ncbi:MAG: transposase [bacterium]|nr:transposase [bacterium]
MINDSNTPLPPALGPVEARSAGTGSRAGGPDPEVVAKPKRRQFTAEYRLRILEEADSCTKPGEVGQLLRREGLYSSHLTAWRKAQRQGALRGLASKKRGVKPRERNPLEPKVQQLEAENARLKAELHKAHTILDVQEKVAGLLGFDLESGKNS